MLKKVIIPMVSVTGLAFLSGCTTQPTNYPSFTPAPVAQNNSTVVYQQKTDTVFTILDASSSTNAAYDGDSSGASKFDIEKQLLYRLNKTIPADISLSTGMLSFGSGHCLGWDTTKLNQEITSYSASKFQTVLDQAECASGSSPLQRAIGNSSTALDSAPGNIALVILSDGEKFPDQTLAEAKLLESKFRNRLCVYTIWVGNEYDSAGQAVLQDLSTISGCGKSFSATELNSNLAMASFVEDMLFTPTTPIVAETDLDGDGVDNEYDKCPYTPTGAKVDSEGCWSYNYVEFAFDGTAITPAYTALFYNAVYILQKNPTMTAQIEGHTDSQGSEKYNQSLSKRRAQAVKDYLVKSGINPKRLTVKGYGETRSIASNETPEGRAENRRVSFSITSR
ncbi:MAG: OmpA family protein [Methyloprofundus sp.]|nr:OmpA family protein [Methyloprofundus sp.]